jgi:hypothetical protein
VFPAYGRDLFSEPAAGDCAGDSAGAPQPTRRQSRHLSFLFSMGRSLRRIVHTSPQPEASVSDLGILFASSTQRSLAAISTKVPLRGFSSAIELPAVGQIKQCELLDRLKREAVEAILAAKRIRWSKDVSLYEDSEIAQDQRRRIDAFIAHLLAGHEGKPCPCGDRPIIGTRVAADLGLRNMDFPVPSHTSNKN